MRLVNIKTVSDIFTIKTSTLYSWVRTGSIPFLRLNGLIRFDLDELEAWARASSQETSTPSVKPTQVP